MKIRLSKQLKEEFATFLDNYPPAQFSVRLRHMLLDYIGHTLRIGFPVEFGALLDTFESFFDLLDTAAADMSEKSALNDTPKREKSIRKRSKEKRPTNAKSFKKRIVKVQV